MRKTLVTVTALFLLIPAAEAEASPTLPSQICVPVAGHVVCVDTNPAPIPATVR